MPSKKTLIIDDALIKEKMSNFIENGLAEHISWKIEAVATEIIDDHYSYIEDAVEKILDEYVKTDEFKQLVLNAFTNIKGQVEEAAEEFIRERLS